MTSPAREGRIVRRAAAFAVDWLVIACWGSVLFGMTVTLSGGIPARPANPWVGQAIGFASMTLPSVVYFALCESSRWRGSVGKRAMGLVVTRADGAPLDLRRAVLRNAIKLAPWELGHTVAQQAVHSGDGGPPRWIWVLTVVALGGPLVWIGGLLLHGRAPYDDWVDCRVSHRAASGR